MGKKKRESKSAKIERLDIENANLAAKLSLSESRCTDLAEDLKAVQIALAKEKNHAATQKRIADLDRTKLSEIQAAFGPLHRAIYGE